MTLIIYSLSVIGAGACLLTAWFIVAACWAARGSPDVNGDPERDAREPVTWWTCRWCLSYFTDGGEPHPSLPPGIPEPTSYGMCAVCAAAQRQRHLRQHSSYAKTT
jgi:hypothetical protein